LHNKIILSHKWGIISKFAIGLISLLTLAGLASIIARPQFAKANSNDMGLAESKYPAMVGSRIDTCSFCHAGAPNLNPYGSDYLSNGRNLAAFGLIENNDSDGDGFTNIVEIQGLTFPGNINDHPSASTPTPTLPPSSPTATRTVPPPSTATNTMVPPPSTATSTMVAPSVTPTSTGAPPSATVPPSTTPVSTSVVPSETPTQPEPSRTPRLTRTPGPRDQSLRLVKLKVRPKVKLGEGHRVKIRVVLLVPKGSKVQGIVTVVGMQNGRMVYTQSVPVAYSSRGHGEMVIRRVKVPFYLPTEAGVIQWTATLRQAGFPDQTVTASTRVTGGYGSALQMEPVSAAEAESAEAAQALVPVWIYSLDRPWLTGYGLLPAPEKRLVR
jgi:hypothetical protein